MPESRSHLSAASFSYFTAFSAPNSATSIFSYAATFRTAFICTFSAADDASNTAASRSPQCATDEDAVISADI
jgi:hypothetical protein